MITHALVFAGSSKEFYQRILNRGKGELLNYLKSDTAINAQGYIDADGYELKIRTFPKIYQHGDVIYRLEFMVEGRKAGIGIWEQIEKDIPPKHELGCVIILVERLDGQTDIVAELHHPAFEPEFNSIFGIDEQDKPGANKPVESPYPQINLTSREDEVAALVARGYKDEQIAEELVIAPGTAKKHRQNISDKWGMESEDIGAMQMEAKRRGYK